MTFQDAWTIVKFYRPVFQGKALSFIVIPVAVYVSTVFSLLLLSHGYLWHVWLVIGFLCGALLTLHTRSPSPAVQHLSQRWSMPVFAAVSDTEEESSTEDQFVSAHQTLALFYPPLTLAVSSAIELFLKQFVSEWWVPLNEHNHPAFLQSVRARLHAATANLEKILFKQKKHDLVMSTVFGVANTLIIHMRECRAYEDSGISLDTYILHYPHSAFAQLLSREEQENQLRQLATTILKRLMLKSDVGSGVLVCLLRELLATHLLGTLMKTCSDPDFINCLMVKHLLKETVEQQPKEEGLLRVVEKATEDAMQSEHTFLKAKTPKEASLLYAPGTIHFSVMDNGPLSHPIHPSEKTMSYILQIERPSMQSVPGSEGGGYVITRTCADFENFHTMLTTRYPKRVARLELRLPWDRTRSWLKIGQTPPQKTDAHPTEECLERYLHSVVQDSELGCESEILVFLAKEQEKTPSKPTDPVQRIDTALPGADTTESTDYSWTVSPTHTVNRALSLLKRSKEDDDVRWFKRKSTADSQIDIPKREEIKTRPPHSSPNEAPLPTEDVELLIETTFALVVELFDLSTKNNKAWVRRSLLNLLREIVRRSYTQLVAEHYNDSIQALLSPEALTQHVSELAQTFWPQGQWTPPPHRSDDEKQSTKRQARTLLMHHAIPGTLRQLIGDQNCTQSMETLWTRLQDPLLNRVLILQLLERTLKPLFG